MSGWNELLELGGGFVKSWLGDIGHEDVGTFFGEEDACFETDAAVARESVFCIRIIVKKQQQGRDKKQNWCQHDFPSVEMTLQSKANVPDLR